MRWVILCMFAGAGLISFFGGAALSQFTSMEETEPVFAAVRLTGEITGKRYRIFNTIPLPVAELQVGKGSSVFQGQVLYRYWGEGLRQQLVSTLDALVGLRQEELFLLQELEAKKHYSAVNLDMARARVLVLARQLAFAEASTVPPNREQLKHIGSGSREKRTQDVDQLRKEYENARRILERAEGVMLEMHSLEKHLHYLESLIHAMERKRRLLLERAEKLTIRSPLNGVVLECRIREGERIPSGQRVLTLLSSDHLFLDAYVPQEAVDTLQAGSAAQINVRGNPPNTLSGRVQKVVPLKPPSRGSRSRDVAAMSAIRIKLTGDVDPLQIYGQPAEGVLHVASEAQEENSAPGKGWHPRTAASVLTPILSFSSVPTF
ncbi:MAG: HlyD family secretion protein [Desulfovibrionales bacterium]